MSAGLRLAAGRITLRRMIAVETIAIADDESHLVLQTPLARKPIGPVKVIVMLSDDDAIGQRQIGHLEGRASCTIGADFVMSDEEILGA